MQYVADLHLHSKYSRAVSPQMTLPVMAQFAKLKGLDILSATDFTHPLWFKEISTQLQEENDGIYVLKSEIRNSKFETNSNEKNTNVSNKQTRFILSTEIASIYKQGEKLRRIHNLVFAPSLQTVEKINTALIKRGCNLSADGRPIIGLSSRSLLELILEIDQSCFLIPCHIWTPHFGLLGSASGFDSIEEAFGDLSKYIYGVETGLSSDPDMNWSIPELKNRSIISCSDAHSAGKMGREATVFELESNAPTFADIKKAIMRPMVQRGDEGDKGNKGDKGSRILFTIEFYPEEGRYHFSGHRNCKVSFGPKDIKEKGTVCPVCHKKMTEGVLLRVSQLADKSLQDRVEIVKNAQGLAWHADKLHEQPPYVKLVPLLEVIAESLHSTVISQKVKDMFVVLCTKLGSEIDVLLKVSIGEIKDIGGVSVAEGVRRVRAGELMITPGYDGEYGKVSIWQEGEVRKTVSQKVQPQLALDL
jgi:DNA helicase II / ATP-dependent DNA helicase PcrA